MVPVHLDSRNASLSVNPYAAEQVFETEVDISDPELHRVDDKPDHVTYKISSASSYPSWEGKTFSVKRRYNDFVWLKAQLDFEILTTKSPIPVRPLPALPNTESFFGWFTGERFSPEFIQRRQLELTGWINVAANHDICRNSKSLLGFLQLESLVALREQSAAGGLLMID